MNRLDWRGGEVTKEQEEVKGRGAQAGQGQDLVGGARARLGLRPLGADLRGRGEAQAPMGDATLGHAVQKSTGKGVRGAAGGRSTRRASAAPQGFRQTGAETQRTEILRNKFAFSVCSFLVAKHISTLEPSRSCRSEILWT